MDMSQLQARIQNLEARRARGESVPELDALYKKMDAMTDQGYRTATGESKPKEEKKARGGKIAVKKKRYAEGGEIAAQQPTYPFYGNQPAASTTQPGEPVNQTFNIQPGMSSADMGFKKGGRVRTASQRADGCAIRGKTRAR